MKMSTWNLVRDICWWGIPDR